MRPLAILLAALLLLAACSGDGGDTVEQRAADTTPSPPTVEPTLEPATPDPSSGDATVQADPDAPSTPEATPTPLPTPTAEATATPTPGPLGVALPAGRYCYAGDDGINEMYVRMTVRDSGQVDGDTRIFISDEESGYFSSAFQRFEGNVEPDDSIAVQLTTWIEFDVQESVESWIASEESLQTNVSTVSETPCDVVRNAYVDATLPGTDTGITADELLERAFRTDERVSFEAGSTSATVANAVVRGEADRYVVGASGGQVMTVSITSLEDNAVVDVVSDSGLALAVEATSTEIFLPHSGDYFIIVSGTRGNASYELTVAIL